MTSHYIGHYTGFLGFVIFVLDLWAIISVISSNKRTATKVIWVVIILLLPILGFILWLLFGPRAHRH